MHDPVLLSVVFIFGICFGSFLNVLIYRLPLEKSLIKPGSHCPKCNKPIKFYDNIPVLSYLILGAKCRNCKTPISIRYPLVEALAGALVVLAFFHFGFTIKGFETAILSLLFIAIFFIDLEHSIIPHELDAPWIIAGFVFSFFPESLINWSTGFANFNSNSHWLNTIINLAFKGGWTGSLAGIILGGGLFYSIMILGEIIFKKEAMGFGDVVFASMLGAFLGVAGVLLIVVLSSFIGSVIGIGVIIHSRKKGDSTAIPYGPFLVLAAITVIYFGSDLIRAYLNFIQPS